MSQAIHSESSHEELLRELDKLQTRIRVLEMEAARSFETELRLREREARYRLFAENVRDVIWTMDLDTRYTFVSPSVEHLRGYTVEEAMGQTFAETVAPSSLEYVEAVFAEEKALELSGKADPNRFRALEIELKRKDGSTVWTEVIVTFLRDNRGRPNGVLGVTRDISERRNAEAALRKWGHIFDNAQWGISVVSAEGGKLELVNAHFAEMHGFTGPEALIGRALGDLVAPACRDAADRESARALETGHHTYETQHCRTNGTSFPVRVDVTAVRDEGGRVLYLAVHVLDITDQKQGERALRMASRHEATATLAGGVAHDFNNLMVGVLGNASLVKMQLPDHHPAMTMLCDIELAAERAGALAQQLLAYARGGKYQPQVLDLNEAINEVLEFQERSIPERIALSRKLSDGLWAVNADRSQLLQVIMNLCINAVEATPGHGSIVVITSNVAADERFAKRYRSLVPGNYVCVVVKDSGTGMDEETRARVFEPFFSTKNQGRGLGLAAVYGIVKNHNGYIYAENRQGGGSVFRIFLPATEAPVAPKRAEQTKMPLGSETVLVIDDEDMVVSVTRQLLERYGYRVLCACDGREAVDLVQEYDGTIDLALLDMGMPRMGGAEAFPLLRKARPKMKIILCSGYELGAASQSLLDSGASAFLQKPFLPRDLCAEIRKALDSRPKSGVRN